MRLRSVGLSLLVILLVLVTIVVLACELPKPPTLLSRGTPEATPTTARVIQPPLATAVVSPTAALPWPVVSSTPVSVPSPAATAALPTPVAPTVQASPTATPPPVPTVAPTVVPTVAPTATPVATPEPSPTATPAAKTTTYIIRWGDTLSVIAQRNGTTTQTLMALNKLANANIRAGQRLLIPAPAPEQAKVHVVRSGESLTIIAKRYGVTVSALAKANGLSNPNRIYAGQRLVIP